MKKAAILYVTNVEEEISCDGMEDLIDTLRSIGVTTVSLANSEKELIHGCFHLITHGAGEILYVTVAVNTGTNCFESRDAPLVLWRQPEKFMLSFLN